MAELDISESKSRAIISETASRTRRKREFIDVTGKYDGKTISILFKQWVSARIDMENNPVYCTVTTPLVWERFNVVVAPDGWCAFRSVNGKYLSVNRQYEQKYVVDPATWLGSGDISEEELNRYAVSLVHAVKDDYQCWEMFRIFSVEGRFAILSQYNGRWLFPWDKNNNGSGELIAEGFPMFDEILCDIVEVDS